MSFSAMFIASTGMQALGTGMGTVSNNLANVNTVGYKTMRTNYQDLISECYFSSGNHNQIGKGSRVATLQTIFNQGAFKHTGGDTDLAIAGEGFFSVRHNQTGEILYTRAGAYTFNEEGYLQDQSGNTLQGWKMSIPAAGGTATRMGSPTDIQINQLTVPPIATTEIKLAVNLNAGDTSMYYYPPTEGTSGGWEGSGFAGAWNANNKPPIATDSYSHSEDLTVYDEAGNKHTLMVYYQKNPHMENVWDYIIAMDPAEEARSGSVGSLSESSFSGLIQKGKITFTGDDEEIGHGGLIKSLEAQNLDLGSLTPAWSEITSTGASSAMSTASVGGYYSGLPVVSGDQYVSSERTYTITWGYKDPGTGLWSDNLNTTPPMSGMTWEDDLGNYGYIPVDDKRYPGPYTFGSGLTVSFDGDGMPLEFGTAGADSITVTAYSEQPAWAEADGNLSLNLAFLNTAADGTSSTLSQTVNLNMGKIFDSGADWDSDWATTTQYGTASSITLKEQNGYPEGSLQRVSVGEDGKVVGVYSQGREVELYQISLTRFMSPWGLDKRGDNLFAETRYSGEARTLAPGEGGAGEIVGNYLEQSTVDTATEIVQMILTQRGFQANSKAITTNDTMLATAIQLKR